jgi:RES domain-containing protein
MNNRQRSSRKAAKSRQAFKSGKRLPQIYKGGDQTRRMNELLVDLGKKTEEELEYWRAFQNHLVAERETRKDRIHESLRMQAISGYANDHLVRIVDTRYQTRPLSSYGSIIVPPGGRFNFGEISAFHTMFQALYVASDFPTAAAERFLRTQTAADRVDQESLILRLDPEASFTSYRIRVADLTVIDIRDDANLTPFTEVISEITVPAWITSLAKNRRQPLPKTLKTVDELKALLFDPMYTQWGSLIDQPAASQWFGHYVREAGIQGIIYPSVRDSNGYNIAIFPDNLKETQAIMELIDPAAAVRLEDRILNGENAIFHMQISSRISPDMMH